MGRSGWEAHAQFAGTQRSRQRHRLFQGWHSRRELFHRRLDVSDPLLILKYLELMTSIAVYGIPPQANAFAP